jgi:FAD/FMN-containing dehydrogenase
LSLTPNPSHLEIVNPVVLGKFRAKMMTHGPEKADQFRAVMPLLLHGDAAFAGQGVVAECFAISGVRGHRTGGTVHLIVNNQIGFTTAPRFSRSSPYPSDVALMVAAPIFHVNGDDPEAVVFAAKVATEYRQKFAKDVVVDMFCYCRFGHNEGDDPTMTNPVMYAKIKNQKPTRELYAARLIEQGIVTAEEVEALWQTRKALSPTLRKVAPKKINEDVVVPVTELPALIDGVGELSRRYGLPIVNFGHAGNGNIHVNLLYDPANPGESEKAHDCLDEMFSLVLSLRGTLSGEHGVGIEKRDYVDRELDGQSLRLMHAIKRQFDPKGILNWNKGFPLETPE